MKAKYPVEFGEVKELMKRECYFCGKPLAFDSCNGRDGVAECCGQEYNLTYDPNDTNAAINGGHTRLKMRKRF